MAEELVKKLEALAKDEESLKVVGAMSDAEEIKAFFKGKEIDVTDEFATEFIKSKNQVVESGELSEDALECVSGGKWGGLVAGIIVGGGIGSVGGPAGMVFGGLCGAIVGGLGTKW